MAKKAEIPVREKAVNAALELAAERGWTRTTLSDIAEKAGVPLHELHEHFDDRCDILAAWGRRIDHAALENAGRAEPGLSPRDRLFDLLMERFEVLNQNRDAATSILSSFRADPKQAVIGLPHLGRSMSWMLEAAGIGTGGIKGAVKVAGLTALYLKTLKTWMDDNSPDMGKTMAALDDNLGRAERWAERLEG